MQASSPEVSLIQKIEVQRSLVGTALSGAHLRRSNRREAERLRVLRRLQCHLTSLSRLLRRSTDLTDRRLVGVEQLVHRVTNMFPDTGQASKSRTEKRKNFAKPAHREAAWALVTEFECTLLEVGDQDYLSARLQEELQLDDDPDCTVKWSSVFSGRESLKELIEAMNSDVGQPANPSLEEREDKQNRGVEMLTLLTQVRSEADQLYRAQQRVKTERLKWTVRILAFVLPAAAVCFGVLTWIAQQQQPGVLNPEPSWARPLIPYEPALLLLMALLSGVVGGALGGLMKLMKDPMNLRPLQLPELPRFRTAFQAQLLLSGTLALIAFVLHEVGVLPSYGGNPAATIAIYGFVAGYSEPFIFDALGLLGLGTGQAQGAPADQPQAGARPATAPR
jgi:hypothetical protein